MAEWREAWVPAVLEALTSVNERLQNNVSVYGLPVPLCMDSGSLVVLLRRILDPDFISHDPCASPDGQVARPNHPYHKCMHYWQKLFLWNISCTAYSLVINRLSFIFRLYVFPPKPLKIRRLCSLLSRKQRDCITNLINECKSGRGQRAWLR